MPAVTAGILARNESWLVLGREICLRGDPGGFGFSLDVLGCSLSVLSPGGTGGMGTSGNSGRFWISYFGGACKSLLLSNIRAETP